MNEKISKWKQMIKTNKKISFLFYVIFFHIYLSRVLKYK